MSQHQRKPASARDAGWLMASDGAAVVLAFVGQMILTHMLLAEHYGWYVVAIDLYASFFLIIDLGLPTILTRDGAKRPSAVVSAVHRIYRYQFIAFAGFLVLLLMVKPHRLFEFTPPLALLWTCASIALVHIASYAPRSGLRVLGEARLESMTKILERFVTTSGYGLCAWFGITSVEVYASCFFIGALVGWLSSLIMLYRIAPVGGPRDLLDLGQAWVTTKHMLLAALPFALTLAVLPYIVRIEKFVLAIHYPSETIAIYHVAQLAWLAGNLAPAAMRAALLPVLGVSKDNPSEFNRQMQASLDISLGLTGVGVVFGYSIVRLLLPIAFPSEYLDGTHGASALDIFTLLLFGWACTLLSTPFYTAIIAGDYPWRFPLFVLSVLSFAAFIGWLCIVILPNNATSALYGAGLASSLSACLLLCLSVVVSRQYDLFRMNRNQLGFVLVCVAIMCLSWFNHSWMWVLGLASLRFIPQGLRAIRTTIA